MLSVKRLFRCLLVALLPLTSPVHAGEPVTLVHVHGLAYTADGKQLMIPSHHGLALYAGGRWAKAPGPTHDYMGFSATGEALYSSGHPAPGSGLTNPFGLMKSRDGGKSWQKLGLEGESDFHVLASGYGSNAVYVFNSAKNSRMDRAGIHFTLDDGRKWHAAAAKGLKSQVDTLAVHPTDARVVAAATREGLLLSRDSASHFERLVGGKRVLGLHFDLDGRHLWFSTHAGNAGLARIELKSGATAEDVRIPALFDDAISYIAQSPARHNEIAVATFKRNVFLSADQGRTWKQVAKDGTGIDG